MGQLEGYIGTLLTWLFSANPPAGKTTGTGFHWSG